MRLPQLVLLLVLFHGGAALSQEKPVFSSATEDSTDGWAPVTEKLATTLVALGGNDDRDLVGEAIKEEGLAHNDRQFFRGKTLELPDGSRIRFVRPASEPHHAPFYGAHTFRFWVIGVKGEILFASSGDRFSVLPSRHEGMNDLMVSQCRGGYCYDTTEQFSHGRYQDGSCSKRSLDENQVTAGCR